VAWSVLWKAKSSRQRSKNHTYSHLRLVHNQGGICVKLSRRRLYLLIVFGFSGGWPIQAGRPLSRNSLWVIPQIETMSPRGPFKRHLSARVNLPLNVDLLRCPPRDQTALAHNALGERQAS
jgi:hypothetical protein